MPRQVTLISETRQVVGRSPVGGAATLVDHPGCQRRFTVDPGAQYRWTESVEIPNVVPGPASLDLYVQVVYPRHCHKVYGCYDTTLHASTRAVVRY